MKKIQVEVSNEMFKTMKEYKEATNISYNLQAKMGLVHSLTFFMENKGLYNEKNKSRRGNH